MQMSLDTAMERTFSVAEFSQLLADVIDQAFPHDVWVQGEIRDISRAQSGHVYFNLVDPSPQLGRPPDAVLAVVLFDSTKKTVNSQIKRSGGGMRIDDGVSVRIRAIPNFYPPQGKLSLRMTGIDPEYTLGQLAASRAELLRRLSDEGLLDANAKLDSPMVPQRIGLVTAASSAAAADFLHELEQSQVSFEVVFAATPVQGPEAAQRIAAAIGACLRHGAEVIAVVRGGGAKTDLAAFDDELVARAIAICQVPVITGIGHEVDTSVADQVAHRSFKTPTACAAHLVQAALSAEQATTAVWQRIAAQAVDRLSGSDRAITLAAKSARDRASLVVRDADTRAVTTAHRVRELATTRLERADARLAGHLATVSSEARHQLNQASSNTDRAVATLERTAQQHLTDSTAALDRAKDRARLLDPARALARGWSITTDTSGAVVRSVVDIVAGAQLFTRVADGRIVSIVEDDTTPYQQQGDVE